MDQQAQQLRVDVEMLTKALGDLEVRLNSHKHNSSDLTTFYGAEQIRARVRTVTATATIDPAETTILADATAGAVTVTLPPAASMPGRVLNVKKIDSSANAVTVDGNASETIDGATTKATTTQWANFQIQSDGSAWYIL